MKSVVKTFRQLLKFLENEGDDACNTNPGEPREPKAPKEKKDKTDAQVLKGLLSTVSSKITESKGWSKKMRETKTFLGCGYGFIGFRV